MKIGLQSEVHTVVYTGLDQHWLKWGAEIKVEILDFPSTNKTFYICTDLKDKSKVCTVTSFMFKTEPLDKKVKATEICWLKPKGFVKEEVEKFFLIGTEEDIILWTSEVLSWMEERYSVGMLEFSKSIVDVPLCRVLNLASPSYPYMLDNYEPEEYYNEHLQT